MELVEIVKKRLEAKGWDFASDYWDDEELTSLHEVILETEAALRQPPVMGSVCTCEPHTFYEWEKDENKCSQCNKTIIKQTDL